MLKKALRWLLEFFDSLIWRFTPEKEDPAPAPAPIAGKDPEKKLTDYEIKKLKEVDKWQRKYLGDGKGRWLTTTANYCVRCKKPITRAPGQVVFFCSKECRKLWRHRGGY